MYYKKNEFEFFELIINIYYLILLIKIKNSLY